ncbi:hypothetical protein AB0907_15655 [Streptomyces sp. NPDC006975]|uniref:hypothetical protein n=1 Tax=Streptomyces sp. NPDC006975 TaxID=3154310 RepID=UPI0034553864
MSEFERALESVFGPDPAGHVEIVHCDDQRVYMLGYAARQDVDAERREVDLLLVEPKSFPGSSDPEEVHRRVKRVSRLLAAAFENQRTLPGMDELFPRSIRKPDTGLLLGAAMLEGVGLSQIRDRIAELMSATEVPVRALRNPGKVLGQLAESGEVARVTNHGKTVGWLVPATEAEQRLDDLLKQGRLRRGKPAPIEPIEVDGLERPLSEILSEARDGERT